MPVLNDDAIAYTFVAIVLFVILATGIFLVMQVMAHQADQRINEDIYEGKLSTQTRNAINYGQQWQNAIPIFIVIIVLFLAIVRAVYRQGAG